MSLLETFARRGLAKTARILRRTVRVCLRLLHSMELIPNNRADETKEVSSDRRQNNKSNGSDGIEWFNDIDRLDHVRPENEVDNRLGKTDQDENCPKQMPASDDGGKDQANFVRISHPSLHLSSRGCW
jgi:hypothetical protein